MTQEEALQFIKLRRKFLQSDVRIRGIDPDYVKLQVKGLNGKWRNVGWYLDKKAAKVIEINSENNEPSRTP